METSLAACVLAALLATGACLQCEICSEPGKTCTGNLQTCPDRFDSCAIALIENTVAGVRSHIIYKTCATASQCNAGPTSVTYSTGQTTRMSIACCLGHACRSTTVTLPPADTKPNGRRCRGCVKLNSSHCTEESTECTGAETQCLYTIQRNGGDDPLDILHGCATKSYCTMEMRAADFVSGAGVAPVMEICTTACDTAGNGWAGFLLSAFAGIFLLKLCSCLRG